MEALRVRTSTFNLDNTDALVLKGMAILAIALHNYFFHFVSLENNEFSFELARFGPFLRGIEDPRQAVPSFFAFLGQYGVQIFIFLSAYGLAKRYWDTPPSWGEFVWSRIKKIYPAFLLAVLAWALLIGTMYPALGPIGLLRRHAAALLLTFAGVESLAPGFPLLPVGPWWFLPFIMQFYCLWPVLRWFGVRFGLAGLILLSSVSVGVVDFASASSNGSLSIWLFQTPLGHLPEICLGVAVARYGVFSKRWAGPVAAVFFAAAICNRPLWPCRFVAALIFMLWLYALAQEWLRRCGWLSYVGGLSMGIFFVNGFTRTPFLNAALQHKSWLSGLLLGFASAAFALVVAQLLSAAENSLRAVASAWSVTELRHRVSGSLVPLPHFEALMMDEQGENAIVQAATAPGFPARPGCAPCGGGRGTPGSAW